MLGHVIITVNNLLRNAVGRTVPGGRQEAIVTTKKWPDSRMRLESDGTEKLRMPGCVHIADVLLRTSWKSTDPYFFQSCRKELWCWM